jgi:hypothetical protein
MAAIEYLDPSIANEGFHAEKYNPGAWADAVPDGEDWQPDIEEPHIYDYKAFKKHKHYGKYFRPYRYVPFPAWMHHATLESKLCQNKEEVAALGPGWSREPQQHKIVMVGKALPIKTDTQRLAETIALGMERQPQLTGTGPIDATAIAAIVAAVLAATQSQRAAPMAPVVETATVVEDEPETEPQAAAAAPSIERMAMLELAEKEGIKIDKRWSDERIKTALGL